MTRALVGTATLISSLAFATSTSAGSALPPPALVERLARSNLVVQPAPTDRPRISLKQAIMSLQRAGFGVEKPYLVYALRLTKTDWTKQGRPVVDHRLVWLFIVPHVANPITGGNCRSDCEFYADMADVVDATSGRWLFAQTLRP